MGVRLRRTGSKRVEHWHIFSFETDFWDNETSKWGRNRIFYDEGTNRKWDGKGQEEDFGERWGGLREENLDTFCPFSEGWHLGCRGFGNVVFH